MQAVGGNTAIALLLTVSTNFLAVFTLPFTITYLLGASAGASPMSPWPLLLQLLHSVLLPTLVGVSMRACIPGAWNPPMLRVGMRACMSRVIHMNSPVQRCQHTVLQH